MSRGLKYELKPIRDVVNKQIKVYADTHNISIEDAERQLKSQGFCERIFLDNLTLSLLFGGGLPLGKVIEFYGKEESGKSSLGYYLIGQLNKMGYTCAIVETENRIDYSYLKNWGVDFEKTFVLDLKSKFIGKEDSGMLVFEEALDGVTQAITQGVTFILFDSIAGAPTLRDMDADVEAANIGVRAKVLTRAVSKICATLRAYNNKSTVAFINQVRANFDMYSKLQFATPGGYGFKHQCSLRIQLQAKSKTDVDMLTRIRIYKTTIGSKLREIEVLMNRYTGIVEEDYERLIPLLVENNVVSLSGNTYTLKNGEKYVGKSKFAEALPEALGGQEAIREMVSKFGDATIDIDRDEMEEDSNEDMLGDIKLPTSYLLQQGGVERS